MPSFACDSTSHADLVLRDGKVVTVDSAFSIHEAVAIRQDQIVFVGADVDVENLIGPQTQVIDLDGALITPGMVDAHGHPFNLGNDDEDEYFSVRGSRSWQEVIDRVATKVATMEAEEWLIGGGWYQDDWEDNTIPVHDGLSAVSADNPVFLYRRGGNSAFVNQKALEIAGITKDTPDPYGGVIGRKPNGEPSGFLVNMGNNLVKDHFPPPDKPFEWYVEVYQRAASRANEVGLTGWHDAGIGPTYIDAYKALVDRDALTVRTNAMLQNPRDGDLESYFREHRVLDYGGDQMFQVRSIKVFFDGALGSRGAAFFEDYEDDPGNTGVFEIRPEHLYDVSVAALKTGMQVCPHSIGPRANATFLDQVERALIEVPVEDHRFRSEHAEVIRRGDISRFADLGVVASIQPIHHTSDMELLVDRLGESRTNAMASPWRALIDSGSVIACGSDFTIYSHNPLTGFHAAVTRQLDDGTPEAGWQPEQSMTREEALKCYTLWPAYAAFWEGVVGSIEVGKLADLTAFDRDIMTIPEDEILDTNVLYTIVGGKVVYERN
jgi:predicted amidohydrolase YtcJ